MEKQYWISHIKTVSFSISLKFIWNVDIFIDFCLHGLFSKNTTYFGSK